MDERKIQEIKAEAARQAAVGASEGGPAERNESSELPKNPVAVEGRRTPDKAGDRLPTTGEPPLSGAGPATGEPAVKSSGE